VRKQVLALVAVVGCSGMETTVEAAGRDEKVGAPCVVSVSARNATRWQATLWVSGGGAQATAHLYETLWLAPGASGQLAGTMAGPAGAQLFLGAMVASEGHARREYSSVVLLSAPQLHCLLTLVEVDGAPELRQECGP
jgi:hypothetical protein